MKRALVLLAACGGKHDAPPPAHAPPPVAAAAPIDAAAIATRCAAADPLPPTTIGKWKLAGRVLSGPDARIGVIADVNGGKLDKPLEVDLVIALGGMGGTASELQAALGAVVAAIPKDVPVIAIPGDLEPAALPAIPGVLDGRAISRIDLASASIALIGGASAPTRLVNGGCIYTPADVAAAFADLAPRPGLRILASYEAPRRIVDGDATGELGLVPGVGAELDLHLHGSADKPSPASKGGRTGSATPISPGGASRYQVAPVAGVLAVSAGAWTYAPVR